MKAKSKKSANVPNLRFPGFEGKWETKSINLFVHLLSGFAFKGEEITEVSSGVPLLRGINITEGSIRHSVEIDRYYLGNTSKVAKYFLKEGDLVIGMDGSKVGKNVALITKSDENSLLIQRVARLRANENSDIRFIYHHISSNKFQKYVDVVNTGSGIPHISAQQIKDFTIGFPAKSEQIKIADLFSLIAERIQTQRKIIQEIESLIQNLRQNLFKQVLRFKDEQGNSFPDKEDIKLGKVCEINPKNSNLPESFIYIDLESVVGGRLLRENKIGKVSAPSRAQRLLRRGDILFQMVRPYQKNNLYFDKDGDYVASTGYAQLRTSNNPKFIFQYLHFQEFVDKVMEKCTGTSYPAINSSDLSSLRIGMPSISEQNKIAHFLSLVDEKINTEKALLDRYEMQKKYLLQNLFI